MGGSFMKTYPVLDPQATGQRIKEIRMRKHISVNEICEYMGFENPQAVYKWQRGESLPTVDNLFALSRLFETSMETILCTREEASASSFCVYRVGFKLAV
jgi:transcriptional regulator with XRE-family HTH domain